ncbi:hypothetical protein PGT21_006173 [Puccinia graminis f. sp. tritici]|uniref:Uncharacterized protein n=1 Tax=Puccinia graminis f. sp. tritici TaxID=56615 RepID=A0A5B0PX43_PUCGR|nr:hypothetical protein PGT21_006173 [Puccinia graminis f. sp. tritici]
MDKNFILGLANRPFSAILLNSSSPPASHLNIFEPSKPVGFSAFSDSESRGSLTALLYNPISPPTITTSTTSRTITTTEVGAENLSERVIQLDRR